MAPTVRKYFVYTWYTISRMGAMHTGTFNTLQFKRSDAEKAVRRHVSRRYPGQKLHLELMDTITI